MYFILVYYLYYILVYILGIFILKKFFVYYFMDFKEIKYIKHYLYDNVEEFSISYPGILPVYWKLGEEKDWVLTDDGHVCQILKKGQLREKALNLTQNYIRTVCGTFIVQKPNIKMLGAKGIADNIYAFSGSFKAFKNYQNKNKLKTKEFMFARYIADNISKEEAYRKAFPKAKDEAYVKQRTSTLLNKESVRTMLTKEKEKLLDEKGVAPGWIVEQYNQIAELSERDSDKLRSLEALAKMSGLFDTEKKQEQLTVWQGFTPEQLEAINGGKKELIAHAEREEE